MSGALESMTLASRRYAEFAFGRAADPEISNLLGRARRLAEAPALLIMELSGLHDAGRLSRSDFGACLELIVSYLMRRAAGGLQTRGYWSIFARLAYELDAEAPRDCLEMGMATLPPTYRFPNDAEFGDALRDTDLHGRYFCRQLLDGLETLGHKEKADTRSLTIEHVMPQTLSYAWKRMLGDDSDEVHAHWLHRLGNLTLTGYNAEDSNSTFQEKRDRRVPGERCLAEQGRRGRDGMDLETDGGARPEARGSRPPDLAAPERERRDASRGPEAKDAPARGGEASEPRKDEGGGTPPVRGPATPCAGSRHVRRRDRDVGERSAALVSSARMFPGSAASHQLLDPVPPPRLQ